MPMLFVTILVDLTLARVNLDIQAMAKIAVVRFFRLEKHQQQHCEMTSHENQAIHPTNFYHVSQQ